GAAVTATSLLSSIRWNYRRPHRGPDPPPAARFRASPEGDRSYRVQLAPGSATSIGPAKSVHASARIVARELHGGMWVRARRRTPASLAAAPARRPVRRKIGRASCRERAEGGRG